MSGKHHWDLLEGQVGYLFCRDIRAGGNYTRIEGLLANEIQGTKRSGGMDEPQKKPARSGGPRTEKWLGSKPGPPLQPGAPG